MTWDKPECVYCKKGIGNASDAVFTYSMKWAMFGHVECYANMLGKYAQDGKLLGLGAAAAGGTVAGAVGGLAGYRKAEEMENTAKGKNRAEMQKTISSTAMYQIVLGILFAGAGALVISNFQRIKLDALGWAAVAILTLIGVAQLYFGAMYKIRLKEFERQL